VLLMLKLELLEQANVGSYSFCPLAISVSKERESAATADNQSTEQPKSRATRDCNKPRVQLWLLKERCARTAWR